MTPTTTAFPLRLLVEDNCNGTFTLLAPFSYVSSAGETITAPIGFRTDFMSIPMVFTNILPRDGKYGRAGVIHDKLYSDAARFRDECDQLLREMLLVLGCPRETADIVYQAVHEFGGSHFGKPKSAASPMGASISITDPSTQETITIPAS